MSSETIRTFAGAARPHMGLRVTDIRRSGRFYEALLGVPPSKTREGYLKFEPAEPSLNLSLIERGRHGDSVDGVSHFGIELRTVCAVDAAVARLEAAGLSPTRERTDCCHAVQDKAWVIDPDGREWEVFVVLADAESPGDEHPACCDPGCCAARE